MSNIILQIQNTKSQIKNVDSQLDNIISIQNDMGMPNIGEKLQNVGIQIINIGIHMINNGMQMPNMGRDTSYLFQQMMIIGRQIQNIVMNLNNNMAMNIHMNNNMLMNMNADAIMQMKMLKDKSTMNNYKETKKKIIFKTTHGIETSLEVDFRTSIYDMLKLYLKEKNHPELIDTDEIRFLYNSRKLTFKDYIFIKEFFKEDEKPTIKVSDFDCVFGRNIFFTTAYGIEALLEVDFGTSIGDMLKLYLKEKNHPELTDTDKIGFLFNSRKLKFKDKTKIEEFFKENEKITIKVNDFDCVLGRKIIFMTTTGVITSLEVDNQTSIGDMLKLYLKEMKHPELINTDKIDFIYNAQKYKFGDKTKIKEVFKNTELPKIIVNDSNNFLAPIK